MSDARGPRIGVVVLHYRYWPGVRLTLAALAQQDFPLERVLVVDNCSADGSAGELEQELAQQPGVDLLVAASNGGYAAGMNLGVADLLREDLDAVLLLTHEAVLSPGAVAALAAALMADAALGAVGPLLVWQQQQGRVYSAGVTFDPRTWSTHHVGADDPVQSWAGRGPQPADSLDGAAVMIRRTAIDAAGPMDETYFLYFEEADYFARLRRLGWRLACVPQARGVQQPGEPPAALWVRNCLRFLAINAPRRVLARELLRTVYLAAGDAAHRRPAAARARLSGLIAFAAGRPALSLVGRS